MALGFRDVKAEILRRIREKTWPPGAELPTETDFAAELGCARATVNRAMREMAEEGVLVRKRKAGTRVAVAPARRAQFLIPLFREEIEATGAEYGYELILRDTAPAPDHAAALGAPRETIHVVCRHLADGCPRQVEERWISLIAAPGAASAPFDVVSPNEWLIGAVPFTDVEMTMSAAAASESDAERLRIAAGAPVFTIERTTWADGRFVTYARLIHPETHRLTTRY